MWVSATVVGVVNSVPLARASTDAGRGGARGARRTAWGASLTARPRARVQLPKIMELVGLGYSSWFVYRYLLFKARPLPCRQPRAAAGLLTRRSGRRRRAPRRARAKQESRKELVADVEELKAKISGKSE